MANLPLYFIVSPRQVVRVDAQRGAAASARQTETIPVERWRAHKRAFISLRSLTFFQSWKEAKAFAHWRKTARGCVLLRRQRALAGALMPACDSFGAALLGAQAALEGRLRGLRAAAVQPGRRYTAEEWREQQAAYRMRRVQPELDEAVAELVRVAEAAVQEVETKAAELMRTVRTSELTDSIGVSGAWRGGQLGEHLCVYERVCVLGVGVGVGVVGGGGWGAWGACRGGNERPAGRNDTLQHWLLPATGGPARRHLQSPSPLYAADQAGQDPAGSGVPPLPGTPLPAAPLPAHAELPPEGWAG